MEDEKTYRDYRRATNARILSLGEECRTQKPRALLTAVLLKLYKGPVTSTKRSAHVQPQMRRDSIAASRSLVQEGDQSRDPSWVRCSISGEFQPSDRIIAAHIVPSGLGPEVVDYIFGAGSGSRLHRPDNCLMMCKDMEEAFDNGNLVIVPVTPREQPLRRWKVVVTNTGSMNRALSLINFAKLGELDGREVEFRTEQRPAARFLYYRFRSGADCEQADPGQPRANTFVRRWLIALVNFAGDADGKEFQELVEGYTFNTQLRLADDEEAEVARRVLEIFEAKEQRAEKAAQRIEDSESDSEQDS
ncbi:MAG: hypothetical protein M1816_006821 [Peltula sp. TS41687]|nr:MAG: hypothetical protein M1816_006821 [Peltula sp. TS41687]